MPHHRAHGRACSHQQNVQIFHPATPAPVRSNRTKRPPLLNVRPLSTPYPVPRGFHTPPVQLFRNRRVDIEEYPSASDLVNNGQDIIGQLICRPPDGHATPRRDAPTARPASGQHVDAGQIGGEVNPRFSLVTATLPIPATPHKSTEDLAKIEPEALGKRQSNSKVGYNV